MLSHGSLLVLKAPGQFVGFPESETERSVTELETRSSHFRTVIKSQVSGSNFDKFRAEPVSKPPSLGVNPVTFKGEPLGAEKVRFQAHEPGSVRSNEGRQTGLFKSSKRVHDADSSSKQEFPQSSGGGVQLDEQLLSGKPPLPTRYSNGEDWRSLSRALATGQKVSAISNHDLMRIAELRFSTDMSEGDSGSQVVLLQKAFLWLGYLSKQSEITGNFGTETKQALREFQAAHGVSQTGVWGPLSKQALWHTISAEILHRVVDEKASKPAEASNSNISGKSGVSTQVWAPMKLADVFTAAMPEGEWRLLSGIALLVVGIFFGLLISKISSSTPSNGNSVKRRIVRSTESENSTSPSKDENQSRIKSRSNGAAVVENMSQLTSKKPSYSTEIGAVGQVDAPRVHEKKMNPTSMYVYSLGHGVQNGNRTPPTAYKSGRKAAYGSGLPSQKPNSSKSGADSIRMGKNPGSLNRPSRDSESVSRMSEDSRSEPLSSSRRETARFQRDGSEPSDNSLSVPKNSPPSQKSKLPRPYKNLDIGLSYPKIDGAVDMQGEDEPNVRKRIEELRKTIEAAEQNGQAAVYALAVERQRSLELEEKISRQRESAAALEEEVRVLKESHDALLESLRKKIGLATRGTSLLYQSFTGDINSETS
eukprot:c23586_g1_i2 orf=505-2451(-)